MSGRDPVTLIVWLVLFAVAGYLLGRWDAGTSDPFWTVVEKWQALITGVFAIGAAWVAWRGTQDTIASSRADTDRTIAEMERQFRHEMVVSSFRDRMAIERGVGELELLLRVLRRSLDTALTERDLSGQRYQASLVQRQCADLITWLSDPRNDTTTSFLTPTERRWFDRMPKVATYFRLDDNPKEYAERFTSLRDGVDHALDALKQVRLRAEGMVPDKEN